MGRLRLGRNGGRRFEFTKLTGEDNDLLAVKFHEHITVAASYALAILPSHGFAFLPFKAVIGEAVTTISVFVHSLKF
jgi:hypothetical protein